MLRIIVGFVIPVVVLSACGGRGPDAPADVRPSVAAPAAVISLLGEPLPPATLSPEVQSDFEAKLEEARADHAADPDDADAQIWLGRRLAYLGRYQEAIGVFSQGLAQHPDDARFLRHRGHRYITTRRLVSAISDLERAARIIEGQPDEIEPDGLPNAAGVPTSTLQSNIWYHLGLARYLVGDFAGAADAYRECLLVSTNPDMLVATSHWLYMTLRRLGLEAEAQHLLDPIEPDLKILENHEYHQLLLMYAGLLDPLDLWEAGEDGLSSATAGYGVANWYLYEGDEQRAWKLFEQILENGSWAAFGYIAAEAEMARASDPH